ncbi:conserved hypothetical protein [Ricinus communis]|uniref:Uncharacterized protein n=1 Tax=Ricinus communis TaxID=3988 RepID=B9SVV3_RICCO|nr:conserved hypothetical protein [Ricinus communis]
MEETLSLAATSRDGRNSMQFSTRRFGAPNVNAISKAKKDKHFYVPPQYRGRFRGHRSPLPWQERIFNAERERGLGVVITVIAMWDEITTVHSYYYCFFSKQNLSFQSFNHEDVYDNDILENVFS